MSGASPSSEPKTFRTNFKAWLPLLFWMGFIFFLSSQPHLPSPPEAWLNTLLKKGAHFIVYGVLALLWWRVLRGDVNSPARPDRHHVPYCFVILLGAFIFTVVYAVSDEIHQAFVPGRNPSPVDVLIDAAGALCALILIRYVASRF